MSGNPWTTPSEMESQCQAIWTTQSGDDHQPLHRPRIRIAYSVYSLPIGKKYSPKTHTVTYLKPYQMLNIPKFSMVQSRVSTWALL